MVLSSVCVDLGFNIPIPKSQLLKIFHRPHSGQFSEAGPNENLTLRPVDCLGNHKVVTGKTCWFPVFN